MHIIRGIQHLPPHLRGAAVVIGNFDGVHLGHQSLMQSLRHHANALGAIPTLVVTFAPHPQKLLNPDQPPERITPIRGKARWIAEQQIDGLLVLHFTRQLAALRPEAFVQQILVEGLGIRAVLVGKNFRFGACGEGHCSTLSELGQQHGFQVYCQTLLRDTETLTVSSTRIRELVKQCRFAEVIPLLGRPFEIEGRVNHGHKRGHSLGFPTANLMLADFLHPPPGVYIVEGEVEGQWLPAVANLGFNPTFGENRLRLEVHLLAPCGDLYRKLLRVRFLHRMRDEITFANSDDLKRQIANDVQEALRFFRSLSSHHGL
ncbi:MAG: riboflavin biosynthesis protein RibF [Magnetococcales bacterium]|nr:riboflavin biosynthesis protein RibF [Magnetococcales bacterium]MBF0116771.1 riboflavin biosynthesis protein RibF [Magnetococcales bacterium]